MRKRSLIDTHCHVFDEAFADDADKVVERAVSSGIGKLLLPNINTHTLTSMLSLCDRWPGLCHPMIGLHPEDLEPDIRPQLDFLKRILDEDRASGLCRYIGIGETGLDLHWDDTRLQDQIVSFSTQIEWALEYDMPVVIHSRDSHSQMCEVLDRFRGTGLRGVFHCFSGSVDEALRLMEYDGMMFGIGGVITYRKSVVPQALSVIPHDRILLETDCPYLAPVPMRGKRNEPAFMVHTAQALADNWNCSVDEVAQTTYENALRLFRI
ncbi:MAG: TatD family hydrolase [Bacteroidaceae bacterium]|nr:TatD family hydrolase [Bacteroidaceae bacterium]